jgi:hypothetical protein
MSVSRNTPEQTKEDVWAHAIRAFFYGLNVVVNGGPSTVPSDGTTLLPQS